MRTLLQKVPPIVWGFIAPAVIIGAVQLHRPDGRRVHVMGAGYVHGLTADDEQDDTFFYELDTRPAEPVGETIRRTRAILQHFPRVIVVGFDVASIDAKGEEAGKLEMRELIRKLEGMETVPVVLPLRATASDSARARATVERLQPWFTATMCRTSKLRKCVRLAPGPTPPPSWKKELAQTVARAVKLHATLPSSKIGH